MEVLLLVGRITNEKFVFDTVSFFELVQGAFKHCGIKYFISNK